jgi:hypothetical protein
VRSDNLLTERDPEKIRWETLPNGDTGLATPEGGGPIAEEHSFCQLSDGSLFCVYRSVDGHPVECYSRDGGYTWEAPQYMTYANGAAVKHPRAANFVWKCADGRYLYWFHNHGGKDYEDRNPVWISGGWEIDSPQGRRIAWSQPEVLFYDDDTFIRMSYPDMIEEDGQFFFTETQKTTARIHSVPAEFLEKVRRQDTVSQIAENGLMLDKPNLSAGDRYPLKLPAFCRRDFLAHDGRRLDMRGGVTLELWADMTELRPGQELLGNWENDRGLRLIRASNGELQFWMSDGQTVCVSLCGALPLSAKGLHHICITADNGPKIVMFIIDGVLWDGGNERQFGWSRFSSALREINGSGILTVAYGGIRHMRIYNRALMVSEAIGNFRRTIN